ncbi:HYDIN protein, partial [Pitta sordida]|nr:HYDIN protein [Pitta sordida]
IKVSARAMFSKYDIQPASSIDFGAMIVGTMKTQVFILENKGILNFKFHILPEMKRLQPLLEFFLQTHLTLGMFTVSPCSGSIAPWGQQKITVECHAEPLGKCEQQLYIDISGR